MLSCRSYLACSSVILFCSSEMLIPNSSFSFLVFILAARCKNIYQINHAIININNNNITIIVITIFNFLFSKLINIYKLSKILDSGRGSVGNGSVCDSLCSVTPIFMLTCSSLISFISLINE